MDNIQTNNNKFNNKKKNRQCQILQSVHLTIMKLRDF